MRRLFCSMVIGAFLFVQGLSGAAEEQIGFRGMGAGLYPDAKPLVNWSPTSGVVWCTAMPDWSNASPVPVGKRIFVCAEPATLVCVNADTGKIEWQDTVPDLPSPPPKAHQANGYTSATPCTDGKKIWAVFGQGVVACWELSGKRLWSKTLEAPPNKEWGGCISPRLAAGKLIVQFDNLFGLDPSSGAILWKSKSPWGWGSPVVAKVGGVDVLYTCKGAVVDAATGKELMKGLPQLAYNSPCLVDGVLYYVQQPPGAFALPESPAEKPSSLWTNITITDGRYYATPLVHDGLVYAVNQGQKLTVMDKKSGAVVYENNLNFLQKVAYPSPTLGGKHIFISSEGGQTVVIEPGREYKEVSRNTLEAFRSCPVFVGDRLYIRGLKNLWCIGPGN